MVTEDVRWTKVVAVVPVGVAFLPRVEVEIVDCLGLQTYHRISKRGGPRSSTIGAMIDRAPREYSLGRDLPSPSTEGCAPTKKKN